MTEVHKSASEDNFLDGYVYFTYKLSVEKWIDKYSREEIHEK